MAQLASQTGLTAFLNASPCINVFQSVHRPTCMYASDTSTVPLGSGYMSGDVARVQDAEVPQHLDYVTGAALRIVFPAVINVTSEATDMGGSNDSVNGTKKIRGYYGGFHGGSEGDHEIIGYATSTAATPNNVFTCTVPSVVQEGDYYVAYPVDGIDGTAEYDTNAFAAANTNLSTADTYTDAAVNAAVNTAIDAVTTALEAATATTLTIAAANQPVHGRVGSIASGNTSFSDRSFATDLGTNAACNYRIIFSRDRKCGNAVGDSSVLIPETDADARFTRLINNGPNIPALQNNMACPAAGVANDIAAYWHSYAVADLVDCVALQFDGVTADSLTGHHMKVYASLFMPHNERCDERLGYSDDIRVLKQRSVNGSQELEMPIPFGFFTSRGRSLNMSQHQYTTVTLSFRLNPWYFGLQHWCGPSNAPQSFTTANALGTSTTSPTLRTKKGTQQNSQSPFYPSTAAPTLAGLSDVDGASIAISVRFCGHYLTPRDRDAYGALTQKVAMPTHAASVIKPIDSGAHQILHVAGNNLLTSATLLVQLQSRLNQGYNDYLGHAISGSERSGAGFHHCNTVKSLHFKAGAKRRTETFSGDAMHYHASSHGITSQHAGAGMLCHAFSGNNPYSMHPEGGFNLQRVADMNAHFQLDPTLFQDNSPSGGLNGNGTTAVQGSSIVSGGERAHVLVLSTLGNVYHYDHEKGQGNLMYPN